jgi:hypothetical protein
MATSIFNQAGVRCTIIGKVRPSTPALGRTARLPSAPGFLGPAAAGLVLRRRVR